MFEEIGFKNKEKNQIKVMSLTNSICLCEDIRG